MEEEKKVSARWKEDARGREKTSEEKREEQLANSWLVVVGPQRAQEVSRCGGDALQ